MAVDRQQRQPEREQQQHRRGLLADAVDLGQPVARLEGGHLAQELEGVVAAFLADMPQGRLDPWRLLVAEAARPDRLDQLGEWRELDGGPVGRDPVGQPNAAPAGARVVRLDLAAARVARAKRLERHLGAGVGAVLGEDREDQLAGRVEPALPRRVPVQPGQAVERRTGRAPAGSARGAWPRSARDPRTCACWARSRALGLGRGGCRGRLGGLHGGVLLTRPSLRSSLAESTCPAAIETSRASRSPQRSTGAGPPAIASSTDLRSLDDRDGHGADGGEGLDPLGFDAATDRDARDARGGRALGDTRGRSCRTRSGHRCGPRR